jgi:hypothetical protein
VRPLPRATGSFDDAMALLKEEGKATDVEIRLMPLFEPVDFSQVDQPEWFAKRPASPVTPCTADCACPSEKG